MTTLTVTPECQVTLRADVLQHLGVRPGDRVDIVKVSNGRLELRAFRPSGHISDVFGMLKRDGQPTLSIDDINRIAAEGWAGER